MLFHDRAFITTLRLRDYLCSAPSCGTGPDYGSDVVLPSPCLKHVTLWLFLVYVTVSSPPRISASREWQQAEWSTCRVFHCPQSTTACQTIDCRASNHWRINSKDVSNSPLDLAAAIGASPEVTNSGAEHDPLAHETEALFLNVFCLGTGVSWGLAFWSHVHNRASPWSCWTGKETSGPQ